MSTIKTSGNAFANLIDRRKDTGNNQYIEGLGGNDTLYGSALDDTIDGGTGADTMSGGAGNDLYFVNSASDSVIEDANGGIDTINTTVSIDLSASASRFQNVENLTVNASVLSLFAMSLGGNAAANVLTGHAGVDTLKGYGGNDTLLGLAGNDSLDGGEGDDLLDGGIGNDKLLGGAGNDTLLGGTGNDTLDGGAGNDSFYVDSSTDVVLEAADAGTDTLYTTLNTFDLNKTANVEGLVFQGAGAAKLTGNALANTLTGGAGNDTLLGGDGNDTLIASAGADVLTGGTGDDRFVIRAGASGTRITDFGNGSTAAGDHIVIDAGVQAPTDLWFQQDTTAGTMTLTVLSTGQTVTIASWDATHAQPWLGQPANPALVAARVDVVIDGSTSSLNMLDVQRLAEVCATLTPPVGGFQNLSAADQAYYQDSIRRVWTQHTLPLVRRPGAAGDDTLTGTTFGGDYLDGQDGNDLLIASDDASTQAIPPKVPYTIDDLLLGGAGNDTLVGGAGADTLMGGAGNDSYVVNFNHGFGYATTIDDTAAPGEANSLKLGAQLLSDPSHFRFARVPGTSNLQISLPAGEVSPGTVQVNGWFDGTARQLATINFGSRTLTAAQVNTLVGLWATYDQADATGKAAAISAITGLWSGSSGLYIPGTSGAETLTGGQGNDTLQGAAGNDTLDGGRGANVLDGGDDDDTLFSAGGNDTLTGGHGVDRFVVHAGSGDTRITDFTQNNTFDAGEHLVIDAGMLAPSDLWFKSDATAGTLVITVLSTGQTITVASWRPDRALTTPAGPADPGWVAAQVDVVIDGSTHALDAMDVQRLADVCAAMPQPAGGFQSLNPDDQAYYLASIARVWDQHTLPLTRVPGTAGDDTLSGGTFTGDFLDGRDGNDLLNARDDLGTPIPPKTPYTMDDLLSGGAGNDTLMGGAGADTLLGGSGNDTYQFFFTPGRSYAATLADTAAPGEANVLQLRAQFGEPYQYRFARVAGSSDLQISLSGTSSGAIRVSGWFDDAAKQLAVIDFGSKAITNDQANALVDLWSAYDQAADDAGKTAALTAITGFWNGNVNHYVAGTSAADALFGFQGNDTLLGAAGNDTLNGGTGNDALEGGYGSDTYLIGHDASAVITDHGSAPDTDTLAFTDASYDALTWQLADGGHTLEIGVAGTTQRVRLPDWQTAANQIEQVQANSPEGTLTLDAQHLAALVSAMASATPPQGAELRAYWQAPLMAVAPGTLPS